MNTRRSGRLSRRRPRPRGSRRAGSRGPRGGRRRTVGIARRSARRPRVEPAPRALGRGQRPPAPVEALEPDVDPGEQLARREGPVALDERRGGPRRSRPARTAPGSAVDRRATRSTSPSQYANISATWASTSRGPQRRLGRVVEALGERPRRAGLDGRSRRREPARRGPRVVSSRLSSMGASVARRA